MQRRELMKYTLVAVAPATLLGRASAAYARQDAGAVPDARTTAPLKVPANGEIKVAFLIAAGAVVVDFAGPWAVFEQVMMGTGEHHRMPFRLYTVAVSRDPVKVSGGMTLVPDHIFADAPAPDVVVVPAVDTEKLAPAALDWLRAVQKVTDVTMSVCDGSFVLGEAGLLDGKKATAHHGSYGALRVYPKAAVVRGVRYVEDGKIATSGGLTSGMDLALRVVERYFGRDVAKATAVSLEYQSTGWMHPESNAQFAQKPVAAADRPLCPVCEMGVDRKTAIAAKLTGEYQGTTYYFCQEWCKKHFVATPARFTSTP